MWTTVYMAANAHDATTLRAALQRTGFAVRLREVGSDGYEVQVPAAEAEEAAERVATWLHRGIASRRRGGGAARSTGGDDSAA
jgi:hypothetical protein